MKIKYTILMVTSFPVEACHSSCHIPKVRKGEACDYPKLTNDVNGISPGIR